MKEPVSIYRQLMGADFVLLPAPVQRFHSLEGRHELRGWVEIDAPASRAARMLARCLGAPLDAQRGPIRFELKADPRREVWTRHFPGRQMESRLSLNGGRLVERLGTARLGFALKADSRRLQMQLERLHFLGVPCPRWLLPSIVAEETASAGRLHFRVEASLPLIGVVASYKGHLDVPGGEPQ